MPATAGIQVRFRFKFQNRLDSGFRRNDGNKSRLPVDKFRTPRLGAEGRSVIVRTKRRRCDLAMGHGDDSECSRVLSLIESRAGGAHQLLRAFWTELTLLGDLRGRSI